MAEELVKRSLNSKDALIAQLNDLSIQLMAEKTADGLLDRMLEECMKITCSDGGSIYLKSSDDEGQWITFRHTRNFSRSFPFNEFVLPINGQSIAGYCVMTGQVLNIPDVTQTEALYGIQHNDTFDRARGYCTVNMLVVPMKNLKGDVLGVLQLVNKKKRYDILLEDSPKVRKQMVPYTRSEEKLITSLASQLAAQLERMLAMEHAEALFESFAEQIADTLDNRCPERRGHARQVARCALALAEEVNQAENGTAYLFEEDLKALRFAALLHDVGKAGMEDLDAERKWKLAPDQMEALEYRIRYCVLTGGCETDTAERWLSAVRRVNCSERPSAEDLETVGELTGARFTDVAGKAAMLLKPWEAQLLSLKEGYLTESERQRYERHAEITEDVLSGIAWPQELKGVPELASAHHERADGKGFPRQRTGSELSVAARILAIAHAYVCLYTQRQGLGLSERSEYAVDELVHMVEEGALDEPLARLFIETETFRCLEDRFAERLTDG